MTPAIDARQRHPPTTPASDARRRHDLARKQWAFAWGGSFRSCEQPRHVTAVFARPRNTAVWGKTCHLVIVATSSHFRTQGGSLVTLPKKFQLRSCLNQRDLLFFVFFCSIMNTNGDRPRKEYFRGGGAGPLAGWLMVGAWYFALRRPAPPPAGGIKKPSSETGPKKAAFSAVAIQHGRIGGPLKWRAPFGVVVLGRSPCSPVLLNCTCTERGLFGPGLLPRLLNAPYHRGCPRSSVWSSVAENARF